MIVKDFLKKRVEYSKSLPKFQSVVKKWQLTAEDMSRCVLKHKSLI